MFPWLYLCRLNLVRKEPYHFLESVLVARGHRVVTSVYVDDERRRGLGTVHVERTRTGFAAAGIPLSYGDTAGDVRSPWCSLHIYY